MKKVISILLAGFLIIGSCFSETVFVKSYLNDWDNKTYFTYYSSEYHEECKVCYIPSEERFETKEEAIENRLLWQYSRSKEDNIPYPIYDIYTEDFSETDKYFFEELGIDYYYMLTKTYDYSSSSYNLVYIFRTLSYDKTKTVVYIFESGK